MKLSRYSCVFLIILIAAPLFGQPVFRFQGVSLGERRLGRVRGVLYSNSGQMIASVDRRTVSLWSTQNGGAISVIRSYDGDVSDLAFSMNDRILATVSSGTIHLWDTSNGQEFVGALANDYNRHVRAMAFLPDGRQLVWASWGTIHVWNLDRRRDDFTLNPGVGIVTDIDYSPDGRFLAAGYRDHSIRIWDLSTGRVKVTLGTQGF